MRRPRGCVSSRGPREKAVRRLLSGNDAMTLYWAARDCLIAGAYSGATVLLRRLILHMTEEKAFEAGTREEAERLMAFAEVLLGRPPEPPSDRSADS